MFDNEDKSVAWLESCRWSDGKPVCPKCKDNCKIDTIKSLVSRAKHKILTYKELIV